MARVSFSSTGKAKCGKPISMLQPSMSKFAVPFIETNLETKYLLKVELRENELAESSQKASWDYFFQDWSAIYFDLAGNRNGQA